MTEVDRRLDELAKSLADRGHTRRGVLKIGAGAFGAMVAALLPGRAWGDQGGTPNLGNSPCAHFCHDVFDGSAAGQCTSDAAHGTGPCVRCGADVTRICGSVTTPDQLVCCVPNKQTCCVNPETGQGTCCNTARGEFCCLRRGICHPRCPDGQVPDTRRCTCRCPGDQITCGDTCCAANQTCCTNAAGQTTCVGPCPDGMVVNPDTCTCACADPTPGITCGDVCCSGGPCVPGAECCVCFVTIEGPLRCGELFRSRRTPCTSSADCRPGEFCSGVVCIRSCELGP